MAPFYEEVCSDLGWNVETALLEKMKKDNEIKLKEFDDSMVDAETNQGEMEVRDIMLKKAEYYSSIGAKVHFFLFYSVNVLKIFSHGKFSLRPTALSFYYSVAQSIINGNNRAFDYSRSTGICFSQTEM